MKRNANDCFYCISFSISQPSNTKRLCTKQVIGLSAAMSICMTLFLVAITVEMMKFQSMPCGCGDGDGTPPVTDKLIEFEVGPSTADGPGLHTHTFQLYESQMQELIDVKNSTITVDTTENNGHTHS